MEPTTPRLDHLTNLLQTGQDETPDELRQIIARIEACDHCRQKGCKQCWPEEISYNYGTVWRIEQLAAPWWDPTVKSWGSLSGPYYTKQAAELFAERLTGNETRIIETFEVIPNE